MDHVLENYTLETGEISKLKCHIEVLRMSNTALTMQPTACHLEYLEIPAS